MLEFDRFYTYEDVVALCRELTNRYPSLCRLSAFCRTAQGREVLLLTITDFDSGDAQERPTYLIHGGIHAHEPASTHGALYTAQRLLEDAAAKSGGYVAPDQPPNDLPLLQRVAFLIIPRLCPDAMEWCVATTARIRSRTETANKAPNTIYPADLDGDGMILTMRQEHPDGRYICDPEEPRLLVDRRASSPSPYYRVFPEGMIHDWDGTDAVRMAGLDSFYPGGKEVHDGRSFDFNRNWSYDWRNENEQSGAGDFPFSEPEMHALAKLLFSTPRLFGMVGYHCGNASIIRGPSWGSREEMDLGDDLMMEEIAQIAAEETGFPAVTMTHITPANPRGRGKRGHSHGFMYHHLGIHGYEIELGCLVNADGLEHGDPLEWQGKDDADRAYREVLRWWDERGRKDQVFASWRSFDHQQLGEVELGGLLMTAIDNPLITELQPTCEASYRFTVRHASRHPWVTAEGTEVTEFGDVYRVRTRVANRGALATSVTNLGAGVPRIPRPQVRVIPAESVDLLSEQGLITLGHLDATFGSQVVEWFLHTEGGAELATLVVDAGTGGEHRYPLTRPGHS